jgi:CDP-paratose 2-epimerase
MILNPAKAKTLWNWRPATPRNQILEEIAHHAEANPDWLEISALF